MNLCQKAQSNCGALLVPGHLPYCCTTAVGWWEDRPAKIRVCVCWGRSQVLGEGSGFFVFAVFPKKLLVLLD